MEDDADGVDEYFDVGGDGHVFHVEEVVFEAFAHFVDGGGVAVFDLPPGGDAGFDALEEEVFGAAFDDLVDVELPLGAVADDGHGAFEDVVELGYFVEAHFAHDAAEGGDAGVVVARECGAAGFGVGVHAAEFVHFEGFAFVADAFLGVEDGSGAGGFDEDGGDEEEGAEEDESEDGEDNVAEAFDAVLPFFHEAGVDGDEGGVEDAVDAHHAEDDVAGIGGDFDDDFAAAVEGAEDLLDLGLLGVFHGDDDFFDAVVGDDLPDVVGGAHAGHYGGEAAFGMGGVGAVDGDEAHEGVAGVGFLVFEVEVGLVGFAVAANEEGGEPNLAVVDFADDGGGLHQAAGVGEGEVDDEEEDEREVVVVVGSHLVVEQEDEEDDDDADDCGEEGLLELFEAGFAEDVFVGSLHGVEGEPAEGDDDDAAPEVGVGEDESDVAGLEVLEAYFPEEEQQGPGCHGAEDVEEDVSDCDFSGVHVN